MQLIYFKNNKQNTLIYKEKLTVYFSKIQDLRDSLRGQGNFLTIDC